MIRGIFFDAAGVFYDRHEDSPRYALRLLGERGYRSAETAAERARRRDMERQATRRAITPEACWNDMLERHGVDSPEERAELVAAILEHCHDVYGYPDGAQALAGLKARGFILGLVTDTMYPLEWKMRWLATIGVGDLFDAVACSTVLGAHKPDPAMYLEALRQAGLRADESAFVGHDTRELAGARQVGMATVAVHYDADAQADYYVDSLLGLLDVPIFQRNGQHDR